MRVLVACEYSGRVRDAFLALGHEAWSIDLLPSESTAYPYDFHLQEDLLEQIARPEFSRMWDLVIAHPPCTDLAVSGARHFKAKQADGRQQRALEFVKHILDCGVPRIALENPISIISSAIRKPDQIIQPWMFGHPEQKATCLWLKGLPLLTPTDDVHAHMMTLTKQQRERVHRMPPGPDRWKERSRTYLGVAAAMALQWGGKIGPALTSESR